MESEFSLGIPESLGIALNSDCIDGNLLVSIRIFHNINDKLIGAWHDKVREEDNLVILDIELGDFHTSFEVIRVDIHVQLVFAIEVVRDTVCVNQVFELHTVRGILIIGEAVHGTLLEVDGGGATQFLVDSLVWVVNAHSILDNFQLQVVESLVLQKACFLHGE